MKRIKILVSASVLVVAADLALAQEEAAKPNADKVIEELSTVGPEALLTRINELKAQAEKLDAEARALREKSEAMARQATTLRNRVVAVEKFVAAFVNAVKPPAEPPAQPPPEPQPAEQPQAQAEQPPEPAQQDQNQE